MVRQLGLAGLAVIWVFRIQSPSGDSIPRWLTLAGGLILLGLAADLLHYAAGATFWAKFLRAKNKELKKKKIDLNGKGFDPDQEDFDPPSLRVNYLKALFWAKVCLMSLAYGCLIYYLFIHFMKPNLLR